MGFDSQGKYPERSSNWPHVQPGVQGNVQPGNPQWQRPPASPGRRPSARTYKTAARRQKSTAVHGILTLLTFGLWSPVWIMACAENARIRRAQAEVAMYEGRRR